MLSHVDSILAKVAIELKYNLDPATRKMIVSLYKTTTGKDPSPKKDLISWFLSNFEFDGTDTWHHKDRFSVH